MARGQGFLPPGEDRKEGDKRPARIEEGGLTPLAHENFSLTHRHSGLHGDGQKVKAASLDTTDPFLINLEPTYIPINAPTSGRKYRIQVIEVLDENNVLQPVIQLVAVA